MVYEHKSEGMRRNIYIYIFFFFKQKTAYEMCGRDWSSDVCSSDLPAASVSNTTEVEFIHDGTKFVLGVTRSSLNSYFIVMNDSTVDVETHKLSDGGLLISYDGASAGLPPPAAM